MNVSVASDIRLRENVDMQALLIGCRLDLQTLRRDVGVDEDGSKDGGLSLLEGRMRRLVRRLETAAATLEEMFQMGTSPATPDMAGLLNREADLRIKNSLQLVASLLERQARQAQVVDTRAALQAANARIDAVARVHASLLDKKASNGAIELRDYLASLCTSISQAFGAEERGIDVKIDLQPLAVQPDTARSIGIIVTELVTNAIRHGFPLAQEGTVRVTGAAESSCYYLRVEDDGVGLPRNGNMPLAPRMGLVLVNALAAQVRAPLMVDVARGTRYTLALPV